MSLVPLLVLVACDPDKVSTTGDLDSLTDSAGGNYGADPNGDDPPEVESGTVTCSAGSNSSGDLFFVEVRASDPQGEDTMSEQDSRVIMAKGSTEIFDQPILFCQSNGLCQGSWRSGDYGGILCDDAEDYDYTAILVDRDGHESAEFDLSWID